MMSNAAEGGRAAREALTLTADRHDEFLQADAIHALCQVRIPAVLGYDLKVAGSNIAYDHYLSQAMFVNCLDLCSCLAALVTQSEEQKASRGSSSLATDPSHLCRKHEID